MSLLRRRRSTPDGSTVVVVADDDPVVRDVLETALRARGFTVISVGDGRSAVDAVRRHSPHAAVFDWLMPGLYGPDVCAELRADPETADVPMVLLTTQSAEEEVSYGFRSGADEYVTKPFHPDEVVAVVRRLVDHPPRHARPEQRLASQSDAAVLLNDLTDDLRELDAAVAAARAALDAESA